MFILCIDDDEDDCAFLSDALRKIDNSIEIRYAHTGLEAVGCLEGYIKSNDLPALITIDINMPGLSGIDTLQEIRRMLGNTFIPIVFMSTSVGDPELASLEEQNVSVLNKPNSLAGYDQIAETIIKSMVLKGGSKD